MNIMTGKAEIPIMTTEVFEIYKYRSRSHTIRIKDTPDYDLAAAPVKMPTYDKQQADCDV